MRIGLFLAFTVAVAALSAYAADTDVNFNVDLTNTSPLNHFWKECVGSGHALLGTRRDWLDHLKNVTRDIGFKRIRFHGIFDDDMSVVLERGQPPNFYNVFQVYDNILSLGVRPIVELSFMPSKLVICPLTGCQYAFKNPVSAYKGLIMPPNDFNDWYTLVRDLATGLVQRYGLEEVRQWHFEVWNEMWGMSFPEPYMSLYNASALAIKSVDSQLAVGGPATMQVQFISEFVDAVDKAKLPCDFVSTHLYPTDPNCNGAELKDADCFAHTLLKAQQEAGKYPFFVTEMNDGLNNIAPGGELHRDKAYAAAFMLHNVPLLTNLTLMSWWTFTDVFEENGLRATPFSNQFGLQNVYGVAKPVYRAFELLNNAGDKRAAVTSSASDDIVSVLPTVYSNSTDVRLYLSNFRRLDMGFIPAANITVQLHGLSSSASTASVIRLDNDHLTAVEVWQKAGSPNYPSYDLIEAMRNASETTTEALQLQKSSATSASFTLTLPPNSGAVVLVK